MDDENVSVSTGRGNPNLSDMKRRIRAGSKNEFDQSVRAFGEKFNGTVRQASETADDGVRTPDTEVRHYDADGMSIIPFSQPLSAVAQPYLQS